ncbi:MAG: hypothetical protein GY847_02300 [Proteobacteria bacterium]|nr:hypothetical protein [Pseudomonadota bacterium]
MTIRMLQLEKKWILWVLVGLIGWVCSACSEQSNKKESAVEAPSSPPVSKMVFKGPGEKLPKEIQDFKIASNPRYFGPNNLFDLINGGAEIYAEYGLKKMVTADFSSKKHPKKTVTVEIYDQGTALGAFGRMARFLSGRTDPSDAGKGLPADLIDRGLFGGTDTVFYKDNYLIHIVWLDESPEATLESMTKEAGSVLPAFANAVASKIESNPPLPVELDRFPKENRIARTDAWEPGDLVGITGLGPGFSSRYREGEKDWILFVTNKQKDAASVKSKIESSFIKTENKNKTNMAIANDRIVGFTTRNKSWTDEDQKTIDAQIDKLKKSFEQVL